MGSFIGGSGEHKPRKVNVHRSINMITDITEARAPIKYLRSVPGLSTFSGAPIPPVPGSVVCYVDSLVNGIADYSVVSGTVGPFSGVATNYGPGVQMANSVTSDDASAIEKSITPVVLDSLSIKFKLVSPVDEDDAGVLGAISSGSYFVHFNPRREQFFDPLTRAILTLGGAGNFVSTSELPAGVWMQMDLSIVASIATCTIRTLPDNVIIDTTVLSGTYTPTLVDAIRFYVDDAIHLPGTIYADISVCTNP